MTARVPSRCARLAAGVAALLCACLGGPAGAQVPPPPEQTEPVFELVAPVASPVCGNAILVMALAPGIVQGQLGQPLPVDPLPLLGPAFVLCGSVPVPPARLRCALDDTFADTINSVTAALAGTLLPIDTSLVGPVVAQVIVVEDQLPPPLGTQGLGETAVTTLECHAANAAPPASPDAPADERGQPRSVVEDAFEDAALPDLSLGDDLSSLYSSRAPTLPDANEGRALRPVAGVGPVGFAYPVVFAFPLVLLVAGGYLGRALTQPVAPPHR